MSVQIFDAAKVTRRSGLRGVIFRITLCLAALLVFRPEATSAQNAIPAPPARQEVVGRLSGDDVSVTGSIGFESENGRTTALLASGSDLTVRSGQAKVDLPDGGDIILCGPAHLSILKSGPAITIALDYGQVHLQVGATAQQAYAPFVTSPLKSRVAAGLLGIFLGVFGVHRFYLGYSGVGVAMLLISILSLGILAPFVALWGFIEGIVLLCGGMSHDRWGRALT